jgi:autotransporter adhesin
MCGLHGDFIVMPDGFYPLTGPAREDPGAPACCGAPAPASGNGAAAAGCDAVASGNGAVAAGSGAAAAGSDAVAAGSDAAAAGSDAAASGSGAAASGSGTPACCCAPFSSLSAQAAEPFSLLSAQAAERSRNFIGRRWKRQNTGSPAHASPYLSSGAREDDASVDIGALDGFLDRVRSHGFTVTAMAFQDCYNLDLERLCHCSLHTYDGERIMPLCVRYLTPMAP